MSVDSKKHYIEIAQRNQYMLPRAKNPFVTMEWLWGVIEGHFFCPKSENYIHRNCPRPPVKTVVIDEIN